jgi:regulation of enolase protein 1 (concanavalin A-like superfamily)
VVGNFIIQTRLTFDPTVSYQGAGLLIWQDKDNFIRLERAKGDFGAIIFEKAEKGVYTKLLSPFNDQNPHTPTNAKHVGLRLQRINNTIKAAWEDTDVSPNWPELGSMDFQFTASSVKVGLAVLYQPQGNSTQANLSVTAQFEEFGLEC